MPDPPGVENPFPEPRAGIARPAAQRRPGVDARRRVGRDPRQRRRSDRMGGVGRRALEQRPALDEDRGHRRQRGDAIFHEPLYLDALPAAQQDAEQRRFRRDGGLGQSFHRVVRFRRRAARGNVQRPADPCHAVDPIHGGGGFPHRWIDLQWQRFRRRQRLRFRGNGVAGRRDLQSR